MRRVAVILAGLAILGTLSARAEEILIRKGGKLVPVTVPDVKESDHVFAGTPTLVGTVPLGSAGRTQSAPPGPLVVNPNSFYSNVTTFSGTGFKNSGATNLAGDTITKLVADDLTFTATPLHPGDPFTVIRFTVANFNLTTVTARPLLRLYQDNAGVPGNLIVDWTFSAFPFSPGVLTFVSFNPWPFSIPAGSKIWAGMTFDDDTGATGATLAQLNNLGQGVFGPPDVGTSADVIFITNTAGDFVVNNPAGVTNSFGGTPLANFGWEFATPVELQSLTAE